MGQVEQSRRGWAVCVCGAALAAALAGCAALRMGSAAEELLPEIDIIQLRTDVTAALDSMKVLRAEVERLRREMATPEKRCGQPAQPVAAPAERPTPTTDTVGPGSSTRPAPSVRGRGESELYDEGLARFRGRNYAAAAAAFTAVLSDYPTGAYAENARYWLGECRYALGAYADALADFRAVSGPPTSEKEDDALLKAGLCCLKLGREAEARELFEKLLREYPLSEYAERARGYLTPGR
jgi:tol-pal system protein YbgF